MLVFLAGSVNEGLSANGYEAIGYLVYTRYNIAGEATHKVVRMFDVKVAGSEWRIRTEPVIEGRGIGFYEVSSNTNDFVMKVTGFDAAYKSSESPFQELRRELRKSHPAVVFFTNPPAPAKPSALSNAVFQLDKSKHSTTTNSNQSDNVATAVVLQGEYPPVDQSYAAFVWFAFTPPKPLAVVPEKMLLQIWDDGNPDKNRFRRAHWQCFSEPPQLILDAAYKWEGKERFQNGALKDISTANVNGREELSAHYVVEAKTNFWGAVLPLGFRLTRYAPTLSTNGLAVVSSTMNATVVRLGFLESDQLLGVQIPGKTYVSDYRVANQGLNGLALQYDTSNALPAVDQLKQSAAFRLKERLVSDSQLRLRYRWLILSMLLIPTIILIVFWSRRNRGEAVRKNQS